MSISILVYGFMILSFYLLGLLASKNTKSINSRNNSILLSPEVILIISIFTFFAAFRWQVGVDHLSYKAQYDYYAANNQFDRDSFELGYRIIVQILSNIGFSSIAFFAVFAFFQIYLIYDRFKNDRYLYPYLGIFLATLTFLSMMNGMRQWLAACIFIWSTKYIINRNLFKYLFCIVFAYLFHKSAIMMLPFYFVSTKEVFTNRNINIMLIILSVFLGSNPIWTESLSSLSPYITTLGYDEFSNDFLDDILKNEQKTRSIGLQRSVLLLLPIFVSYYCSELSKRYANRGFNFYYTIAMIGTIYLNLFANTHTIFLRPELYFNFFTPISTAFLLSYLRNAKKTIKNQILYIFIIILSISFIFWSCYSATYNEKDYSNYKFIFDNNH
ncbi:MAG: EpsG family protein [Rikenellaceae bacterium]